MKAALISSNVNSVCLGFIVYLLLGFIRDLGMGRQIST